MRHYENQMCLNGTNVLKMVKKDGRRTMFHKAIQFLNWWKIKAYNAVVYSNTSLSILEMADDVRISAGLHFPVFTEKYGTWNKHIKNTSGALLAKWINTASHLRQLCMGSKSLYAFCQLSVGSVTPVLPLQLIHGLRSSSALFPHSKPQIPFLSPQSSQENCPYPTTCVTFSAF